MESSITRNSSRAPVRPDSSEQHCIQKRSLVIIWYGQNRMPSGGDEKLGVAARVVRSLKHKMYEAREVVSNKKNDVYL